MPLGYHGKILVVNLSESNWRIETLPDGIYRQYYGGYSLGVFKPQGIIMSRVDFNALLTHFDIIIKVAQKI